jgi:hypothetical protein
VLHPAPRCSKPQSLSRPTQRTTGTLSDYQLAQLGRGQGVQPLRHSPSARRQRYEPQRHAPPAMPKMDPNPANRCGRANHHHGNAQAPAVVKPTLVRSRRSVLWLWTRATISRRLPVSGRGNKGRREMEGVATSKSWRLTGRRRRLLMASHFHFAFCASVRTAMWVVQSSA